MHSNGSENLPRQRDIRTPSGRALTLMNPAFMTRQIHELQDADIGARGHITSLRPVRPQNAADEWETHALREFEHGVATAETADALHHALKLADARKYVEKKARATRTNGH